MYVLGDQTERGYCDHCESSNSIDRMNITAILSKIPQVIAGLSGQTLSSGELIHDITIDNAMRAYYY
jgi:hypothetical protein